MKSRGGGFLIAGALKLSMVLLAIQLLSTPTVCAKQLSITPATEDRPAIVQTAELKATRIGPLSLPHGTVNLKEDRVEVYAVPEWLFDDRLILEGITIGSRVESSGAQSSVSGLVYFTGGDWIANLGPKLSADTFTTRDGKLFRGTVLGTTADTIQIQTATGQRENLKIKDIQNISSIRAFRYVIGAADIKLEPSTRQLIGKADLVTFVPSSRGSSDHARVPQSHLPGTEGGISNAKLATFIAVDLVHDLSPAVVTPLVFTSRNLRARKLLFQAGQQNNAPTPAPAPASGSGM